MVIAHVVTTCKLSLYGYAPLRKPSWLKLELQKTLLIPPPNRQGHRQFGGGLGGPQVMLAVVLEAKNSTATARFG
jgi:hypothetical protein